MERRGRHALGEGAVTLVLAALALLVLLGLPAVLLIDPTLRRGSLAGVSFLLGCGMASLLMFALSLMRIPWSRGSILAGTLLLLLTGGMLARQNLAILAKSKWPKWRDLDGGAIWADVLTLGLVANHARYAVDPNLWSWERWVPLWRRDWWGIWGLKSKLFFDSRGIDWSVLDRPVDPITHPDYPLLVPLSLDYVTILTGSFAQPALGLIFTAFGAALLLILREVWAKETGSPLRAAVATLVMTPAALTIYIGLAEGPLVAFSAAALILMRGQLCQDRSLVLPATLLGFAALTKNEGQSLVAAVVIAVLMLPGERRRLWELWPAPVLLATWVLVRIGHNLATDLFQSFSPARVWWRVTHPAELASNFSVPSLEHQFFWAGVAASLAMVSFERLRRELLLVVSVAVQLVFFLGSYLLSPHSLGWQISSSWGRLVTQLAVPISFVAILALFDSLQQRLYHRSNPVIPKV